ncbi:MAG: hypothetical protein WCH44_17945 [Betaproteobacteria bacterium]
MLSTDMLLASWTPQELSARLIVFLNILAALLLGLLVGYERGYHGRVQTALRAMAQSRKNGVTMAELAGDVSRHDGVQGFHLNDARN